MSHRTLIAGSLRSAPLAGLLPAPYSLPLPRLAPPLPC